MLNHLIKSKPFYSSFSTNLSVATYELKNQKLINNLSRIRPRIALLLLSGSIIYQFIIHYYKHHLQHVGIKLNLEVEIMGFYHTAAIFVKTI